MIKFLRRKDNQRRLMILMAILIIPSFVLFGITVDSSRIPAIAGHIENKKIPSNDFIKHYQALLRELELFHGINASTAQSLDFEELTWQRILLIQAAQDEEIKISDEEVVEWLQTQQIFYQGDKFDQDFYNQVVTEYFKMSPRTFEEDIRDFLALRAIREKMRSKNTVDEEDVRDMFYKKYAPRSIQYLLITSQNLETVPAVSEEDVMDYYEKIKDRLLLPEGANVRYISRDAGSPDDKVNVQSLLETEGVVSGLFRQDRSIPGIGYSDSLTTAIFSLANPGDTTRWLGFQNKEFLFQLIAKDEARPMTLDEAKAVLRRDLVKSKIRTDVRRYALGIKESIDKMSFEDVASEKNLTIHDAENFKWDEELPNVGELASVSNNIQMLDVDEVSPPIQTSNGYIIIKTIAFGKPNKNDWIENKDNIRAEIKLKNEADSFQTKMNELLSKLTINNNAMKALFPNKYPSE